MNPTTKLVTDMVLMQACYINTTHPDFIGGHQATALVTEKLNAAKAPPAQHDPKRAINNNKDLDVDPKRDEGFFSSFFSKGQQQKKKGAAAMDAPPPTIRPQNALSERETMETEVISAYRFLGSLCRILMQSLQKHSFTHTSTSSSGR